MTPRKEFLFNFRSVDGGKVLMGNDQTCNVNGIGSVKFQLWDGFLRVIENVRWVPQFRRNLLSLGMFDSNGCSYRLEEGKLKVMKGSMVVLIGFLHQGLYTLEGKEIVGKVAIVKSAEQTRL